MPFFVAGIATLLLSVTPASAHAARAWTHAPAIPGSPSAPLNGYSAATVDGALTTGGQFVTAWIERVDNRDLLKAGAAGALEQTFGGPAGGHSLVADDVGGAWVAWTDRGQSEPHVKVAHRSAGGTWSLEDLGEGDQARIAVGADGTAAVHFHRPAPPRDPSQPKGVPTPGVYGNLLRVRRPGDATFGDPLLSSVATGPHARLAVGNGTIFAAAPGSSAAGIEIERRPPGSEPLRQTLDGGGESTYLDLVADAQGRAALAITDTGGAARLAVADSGEAFQLVEPGEPTGHAPQLEAGDIRGTPTVALGREGAFVMGWSVGMDLHAATGSIEEGTVTEPALASTPDGAYDGEYLKAAFAPDGTPAIGYLAWHGFAMHLARKPGAEWTDELVHCPLPTGFPRRLSFTASGSARLLWFTARRAVLSADADAPSASPASCEPPGQAIVTPAVAPPGIERTVDLTPIFEPGEDVRFAFDEGWLPEPGYTPVWEAEGRTSAVYTFTPQAAGANMVGYRISDGAGSMGSAVPVFTSNPPEATLTATPRTVVAGERFDLKVTATDIDPEPDTIVEWVWDLDGDGAYEHRSGGAIRWSFGTPGEHTVGVRVRDRWNATDEAQVTVSVQPKPADEEPPGDDGDGIVLPPAPEIEPLPGQEQHSSRPKTVRPPRVESAPVQELDTTLDRGLAVQLTPTVDGTAQVRLLEGASGTTASASKVRVLASRKLKVRAGRRVRVRLRPGRAARARLRRAGRAKLTVEVRVGRTTVRRAVRLR